MRRREESQGEGRGEEPKRGAESRGGLSQAKERLGDERMAGECRGEPMSGGEENGRDKTRRQGEEIRGDEGSRGMCRKANETREERQAEESRATHMR